MVEATIGASLPSGGPNLGLVVRYADANNYVRAVYGGETSGTLYLEKRVGGSGTTIASRSSVASYVPNAKLRLEARGAKFIVYLGGLAVLAAGAADAGIQSGTRAGVHFNDTNKELLDFAAYTPGP